MALAFVLDEHLRGPLWQAILRHNLGGPTYSLDVVRVGDSPELPLASNDSAILQWAEKESRLLVTEDRHTMLTNLREHLAAGRHSPGIIVARGSQPARVLVECLVLIAYAGQPEEFADSVAYVP